MNTMEAFFVGILLIMALVGGADFDTIPASEPPRTDVMIINNDARGLAYFAEAALTPCGLGEADFERYVSWKVGNKEIRKIAYQRMTMTGIPEECIAYAVVYLKK